MLGEDLNSLLGEIAQYLSTLNTAFSSATDSLAVPIVSLLSVAAPASLALSQRLQAVVNGKNLLITTIHWLWQIRTSTLNGTLMSLCIR